MEYITYLQKKKRRKKYTVILGLLVIVLLATIIFIKVSKDNSITGREFSTDFQIPEYTGQPYIEINGNRPYFENLDKNKKAFEKYSELDNLGRCGVAYANLGTELMPKEERGSIGQIKPAGWHTVKYPDLIEGMYLYNRCHLIAWCLAGENANEKNLITGTRYMNIKAMLPLEEKIAGYIDKTGNHVLYRVTPIYEGKNLLASGVVIEAYSVEDRGKGICFCVYCFNVQPGIIIDYATGESWTE